MVGTNGRAGRPSADGGPDSAARVLRDTVVDEIGERIVHGRIPRGARFTLDDLQEHFEVSRTVARDAMRVLESLGLMFAKRRVGLVVTSIEHWQVHDPRVIGWRLSGPYRAEQFRELVELRLGIEPIAAAGAAARAPRAIKSELVSTAGQMRDAAQRNQIEEFIELDARFHGLILSHSGNTLFDLVEPVVAEVIRGHMVEDGKIAPPAEDGLDQHDALALAISSGNQKKAMKISGEILLEASQSLDAEEASRSASDQSHSDQQEPKVQALEGEPWNLANTQH